MTLRSNTFTCFSNKSCLGLLEIEIDNDGFSLSTWLQLVPVVMARDNTFSPPSIHRDPPPTKPVQLHHQCWLCHPFSNNFHSDRSIFPNIFHRSLRIRQNSLPYAASPLYLGNLDYTAATRQDQAVSVTGCCFRLDWIWVGKVCPTTHSPLLACSRNRKT